MGEICHACGFDGLGQPQYPLVSGTISPSFEICPCCFLEAGLDDCESIPWHPQWRKQWIDGGMKWTFGDPPDGWDPLAQLQKLETIPKPLTSAQIRSLDPQGFAHLGDRQLEAIDPRDLASLTPDQVLGIAPRRLACLGAEQLRALTKEQIAGLTLEHLKGVFMYAVAATGYSTAGEIRGAEAGEYLLENPNNVFRFSQEQLAAFERRLSELSVEARSVKRAARAKYKHLFASLGDEPFARSKSTMMYRVRPATPADISEMNALIERSVRALQSGDYTPEQLDGALATVYGIDSQLIDDGTYLVVEAPGAMQIIACGGWSKRTALFGGDAWHGRATGLLDPRTDAAKIRAFYVHPDWARRGVGTRLLTACEDAALAAGFTRAEMGATLTGAKLFAAKGYRKVEQIEIPIPTGTLTVIHMEKQLI